MNHTRTIPAGLAATILVAVAFSVPALAYAHSGPQGGKEGGGGSVVNDRGRWVLADMFLEPVYPGEAMELNDETRSEITLTARLTDQFVSRDAREFSLSRFWLDVVNAEYRMVDDLPCEADFLPLPDSSLRQIAYGCTQGSVTYLLRDRFNSLDFENRLLALIHERLHAFAPKMGHQEIGKFVLGASTLRSLHREQSGGKKRWLHQREIDALNGMHDVLFSVYPDFHQSKTALGRIWRNGGGILVLGSNSLDTPPASEDQVAPDVFISVGSSLKVSHRGRIRNTEIQASKVRVADEAEVFDSGILHHSDVSLRNRSRMSRTKSRLSKLSLGDDARLVKVEIEKGSELIAGESASLSNVRISNSTVVSFGTWGSVRELGLGPEWNALLGSHVNSDANHVRSLENCGTLYEPIIIEYLHLRSHTYDNLRCGVILDSE